MSRNHQTQIATHTCWTPPKTCHPWKVHPTQGGGSGPRHRRQEIRVKTRPDLQARLDVGLCGGEASASGETMRRRNAETHNHRICTHLPPPICETRTGVRADDTHIIAIARRCAKHTDDRSTIGVQWLHRACATRQHCNKSQIYISVADVFFADSPVILFPCMEGASG